MFTTDITPNDFDDAAALFDRLATKMSDMTEVFDDLGEFLTQSTKDRFTEGVDPQGNAWAPKSEATIASYRRREGRKSTGKIDLRPLFGPSGKLSSQIHYETTSTSVEIGSALIYAGVMQHGASQGEFGDMANESPIPWGDIPARPFLGISDSDETGIYDILAEWLQETVEASAD